MFANTTDYIILLDFVDVFLLIVNILIRRMNNHFINLESDFFRSSNYLWLQNVLFFGLHVKR